MHSYCTHTERRRRLPLHTRPVVQVFIGSALVPYFRRRTVAYALSQKAAAAALTAEIEMEAATGAEAAVDEAKPAAAGSKAGSSCETEAELDKGSGSRDAPPLIPHS